MDRDKENTLAMGRTDRDLIGEDRFASVRTDVPAVVTDQTKLADDITAIEDEAEAQSPTTEGLTDQKLKLRRTLASATMVVAGGLRRIARASGNSDLLHQASLSVSDLTHGREDHALTIAGTINDLGAKNAAALVAVNVSAAKLTALDTAWGQFKQMLAAPRQRKVDTKSATDKLETLFGNMHLTLADLDDLAETVRETHVDFYTAYKNARIVIDRPGGQSPKKKPPQP